jgi:hypothetical protein
MMTLPAVPPSPIAPTPSSRAGGWRAMPRRRLWGLWLALLALAALALIPEMTAFWALRPFQPQTPATLARAYALRRAAPWLGLAALGLALALGGRFWPRLRWAGRILLVLLVGLIGGGAWLARQELFERMFAPLPAARYARAAAVDFVAPGDPVLGVEIGGDAVAYPVRILAYHHVVEDVTGGTPIVATY